MHVPSISSTTLGRPNLSVPQPPARSSLGRPTTGFPPGVKDLSPAVTITPAPPQPTKVFCSTVFYFFIDDFQCLLTNEIIQF